MNDAEYEKQKARVEEVSERWRGPLGCGWWRIANVWERELEPTEDGRSVAGKCWADWRYMEATITWYLPTLAPMPDRQLEEVVIHEMSHMLVNEMREPGIAHEERVVTTLAKAALWIRDAGEVGELRKWAPSAQLREIDDYLTNFSTAEVA